MSRIMETTKQLMHESNTDVVHAATKGSIGFAGAAATMSINDWAGLIVAVLTGIYMIFQIESAWRKRKAAIAKQKEAERG